MKMVCFGKYELIAQAPLAQNRAVTRVVTDISAVIEKVWVLVKIFRTE